MVYAGEVLRESRVVHVLGYINQVHQVAPPPGLLSRLTGARRPAAPGNAMLLHFPACAPMGPANIVSTESAPFFLRDMVDALTPASAGIEDELGVPPAMVGAAQVFESGAYTIVLAHDANDIAAALSRVPAEKRPALNPQIFQWYARTFPGWPVALCCFSGELLDPAPLLWWYEPRFPEKLFAPGLDAHDGNPPVVGAQVDVDHWVMFGSHRLKKGAAVLYRAADKAMRSLLPVRVVGKHTRGAWRNGDFVIDIADVLEGGAEFRREILR
jgi:hypothetical protein